MAAPADAGGGWRQMAPNLSEKLVAFDVRGERPARHNDSGIAVNQHKYMVAHRNDGAD